MNSKYIPVGADEKMHDVFIASRSSTSDSSRSALLGDHEESQSIEEPRSLLQCTSKWMWLVHTILLSASFTLFVAALYTRASTYEYVKKFSAYSPATEAVEFQTVRFNNTMGQGSPYVGKGAAVDAAWNAISYDVGDQMISEAELDIIGMPQDSLKVTHPKTGIEGYRVGLEVFHQLHCINLLRKFTFRDHYADAGHGDFTGGDEDLRMHLDHCLEILRMNIQCNADIGVFTLYLLPGDPLPWPELNSLHTCRNFDKVRDWAIENSVGNMERGLNVHE